MNKRAGQGFLALVFLVGLVAVGIGLTLIFLSTSAVNSIFGFQAALRAEAVATSGAQDALLQLTRNSGFSSPGGYNVIVGSNTATVTVTQSSSVQTATILSVANLSGVTRKVQVLVSLNASTSAVSVISWSSVQ